MSFNVKETKVVKIIGWVIIGLVIAAGTALLFGFFVMILWNWLMPSIFGLSEITYLQAWGLVLMSHILFKSGNHSGSGRFKGKHGGRFGGRGHGKGHHHKHGKGEYREDWKREFFSKMHEHDSNIKSEDKNSDTDKKTD